MSDRHELAAAMQRVIHVSTGNKHVNTINAARRAFLKTARACGTNYGNAHPYYWAADWLDAVSSGHPEYTRVAEITKAFRAIRARLP